MSDFYIHEGNRYIVRKQKTLNLILLFVFLSLSVFSLISNEYSKKGYVFFILFLAIAFVMLISLRTRIVFDLDKNTFFTQIGNSKPKFEQSLNNFAGLELIRQYRFFGLIRNSILNVVFDMNGKLVKIPIRQFGQGNKTS